MILLTSYNLNANCYIVKPADLDQFFEVIHQYGAILAHDRDTSLAMMAATA